MLRVLGALVVFVVVLATACPQGPAVRTCNVDDECLRTELCIQGVCQLEDGIDGEEGEGEEGEGEEGEGEEGEGEEGEGEEGEGEEGEGEEGEGEDGEGEVATPEPETEGCACASSSSAPLAFALIAMLARRRRNV